ncbi:MAG: aminotransferase class III-fold pyridoxal phosphate-dependent enzyme [Bacteroidetes bacterium]|nr:aminotransferase class III-fold pyridoxal phosphate-dependent enzyme [Bacteroidota bacterium]
MKTFNVYPLLPVTPVSAKGAIVTDENGIDYLDFYGGHAVISVGHSHPHYVNSLKTQLDKIAFYSNAVQNPLQEILAEKLGKISGYEKHFLFLCNSGAEANENALKLSSFHNERKKIIAFEGSFHGRTSAAVAATNDLTINAKINLQHEVEFIPLNDFGIAEKKIDETVSAVIIEGIQGVAGVVEPTIEFLQFISKKCKETGTVLILDEVQSGCGRTGDFFAHTKSGIEADLITMAKGLGNGYPIGAVLIAPHFQAKHGLLGTTFGGNYLACTAAISVLEIIEMESLQKNAELIGHYLHSEIFQIPGVTKVSGRGLMIGVTLEDNCAGVRTQLLNEHHIFTGSSSCKKTLRLLPPLNITMQQAELFVKAFSSVMKKQLTPAN